MAARMWCRDLGIPTVRALAAELDRSPVTVLHRFGHLIDLYSEVIHREWAMLIEHWYTAAPADGLRFLRRHAHELAAADQALLRLPCLVEQAVVSSAQWPHGIPRQLSVPLHVLAAVANQRLPTAAALRAAVDDALGGSPGVTPSA